MFLRSVFLVLFAFTATASATTNETLTNLEKGKPVERQLAGDEVHSYRIDLLANQYAEVVVEQRGIDLAIWLYDLKGQKLVEGDITKPTNQEWMLFAEEQANSYRLEIRPASTKAPAGSYEIKIKEVRPATEKDRNYVTAWRMVATAIQLERQATADSVRKAIAMHQEAIPLWRLAGAKTWECNVNYLIANDYLYLGDKQKAFEFAEKAIALAQLAVSESTEENKNDAIKVQAAALGVAGGVHNHFGDKKKALEYFERALPLHRSIGNRTGELYAISDIAMAYQYIGDIQNALTLSNQALAMAKELGDHSKEGVVLNNICTLNDRLGNYKQAIEYCIQALANRRQFNDRYGEAIALNNLGNLYGNSGDYQQSLDFYRQAEALNRSLKHRSGVGIQLNNIAWLYSAVGEYEKSIDFYNQAVEIFTAEQDQYRLGNVLSNLAARYMEMGDYQKALDLNLKVLTMRRAVNNSEGAAVTLRQIANSYAQLNEKQKALEYYNQAIEHLKLYARQLGTALRDRGTLYRNLGEQQNAIDSFNDALQVYRRIGDRLGEADTLAEFAKLERDRGRLMEAKSMTENALASVESLRVNLKSQQLRASFFGSVRKYHELYISVLMQMHKQNPSAGYDSLALQASENARARSLLELLMEANAQIQKGVDVALVEREQKLRSALSAKAEQQMRILGAKHTEEDAKRMKEELDALADEYEQVQAKIRQTSPRYAALTQPVPLTLKEIQSQTLDENTILLEYSLGDERSFLWTVSPGSLKTFELPKRAEVEAAARRVYDLVTASGRPDESIEQRQKRLRETEENYPQAIAALSRMLLGPAAAELKNKRLLIVAEGVLQYVPFSALSEPDQSGTPLMVKHEIVTLPSASVLNVLRHEAKGRVPASKGIAVFADPVFESSDARFSTANAQHAVNFNEDPAGREVTRSANESGLMNFPRLRFSREEANQIMKFAPRNKSIAALDFAANRMTATSSNLQDYRIVHFATHGIINSRHAELSGIVLSLVDNNGRPQNGFLRLYDVYNMNLKADLVVLSACQTALGRDIKGEGLIGLTRAFMYGGATRVVASLWQADDRGTAVFMSRFYEALLSRNMSAPAALRHAQVSMWQDKRWQNPRYWAAFSIQGEWK